MRSQTRRLKNDSESHSLFSDSHPVTDDVEILRMFKCSLLLRLYEPVFAMQPGSIAGPGGYSPGPVQRTDCIWEAIRTSTEFFDTYLDTTPAELSFLPSTFISLHAFSNIATSRILTADASPDWDPATARRTIDYVGYLTRISEQYRVAEQLAQKNGWKRRVMDSEIPAFTKFSNKLQWIAQWYIGRIDPEQQLVNDSEDGQAGTDHTCWEDETFENVWQDLMSFQDPGAFGHFGFDAF